MVCIPCIVVPFLLWVFHRFIRPIVLKFWNPKKLESKSEMDKTNADTTIGTKEPVASEKQVNGVANGHVTAGGDKKTD